MISQETWSFKVVVLNNVWNCVMLTVHIAVQSDLITSDVCVCVWCVCMCMMYVYDVCVCVWYICVCVCVYVRALSLSFCLDVGYVFTSADKMLIFLIPHQFFRLVWLFKGTVCPLKLVAQRKVSAQGIRNECKLKSSCLADVIQLFAWYVRFVCRMCQIFCFPCTYPVLK
jgi:hypothetical protein